MAFFSTHASWLPTDALASVLHGQGGSGPRSAGSSTSPLEAPAVPKCVPLVTVCRGLLVTCRTPTNGAEGSQLASLFFMPDLDCLPPPRAPAFPREPCLSPSPSSPNQQHLPSACHLRHVGPSGGAGYCTRLVNSSPPTHYTLSPH